ncbi:MAG: endonuclease/exonuclease/phosphatase family protein [Clostridiales bacterium]|nr:endonuclease/exonuclease/phosphatase family protein [Clostridiales bacterium]
MRKIFALAVSVIFILSLLSGCAKTEYAAVVKKDSSAVSAVTFNCAAPWGNAFKGTSSSARVKKFAAYMNAVKPDIIGTQEMNSKWLDKLGSLMNDYDSYGVKRGGDDNENKSEMNAVFWLKDKYEAIEKGTFWLSETPDEESRYDGAGCNRVCTWVILKNKESGKQFLHMNTHLDNASEEAADFGAGIIMQRMQDISLKYNVASVVLTGDFNETPGMEAYNTAATYLKDSMSGFEQNEKGTYQDWGNQQNEQPIDFIFVSKSTEILTYEVLDNLSNGYISDHFGVYSEMILK